MSFRSRWEVLKPHAAQFGSPAGMRCIRIMVPDAPEYVELIAGLYSQATKAGFFFGSYEDITDKAALLGRAYTATDWEGCMTCEDVADCIENDPAVQTAINNVYNQYGTGVEMPEEVTTTNIGGTIIDCSKDHLWGAINELVESMNENNIDAQEALEVLSQGVERMAAVIAAIPIFETLPVDDFIDYVQGVLTDDIFTAYIGNDTDEYRDEIKCAFFCIAIDNNCVLTLDDMFHFFTERIGYIGLDDFISIVNFMTSGTWVGTQINDIFYMLQILALKFGNTFFSIAGLYPFEMYMALGANNPDPDWEILCTECNNLCRETFDFTNQPDSLTVIDGAPDSFGFIESEFADDVERVIFTCAEVMPGNMVRFRLLFSDDLEKNCQVFTGSEAVIINGDPVPYEGVWALTGEATSPNPNFLGALARQTTLPEVAFHLMGITIVYEC